MTIDNEIKVKLEKEIAEKFYEIQSRLAKGENGFSSKGAFLIGGALLITINFLVAKTIEYNNERLLMRAIEEYNKKNLPRIYFSPFKEDEEARHRSKGTGFSMGLSKDF